MRKAGMKFCAQENSYFELLLTYCNKLMEAYQAKAEDNIDKNE